MFQTTRETPIEVTKEELLKEVESSVQTAHLMASIEYSIDLMLDMHIKIMDAMVGDGSIKLTDDEKATYDKLKAAQTAYHTFSLAHDKFPDGLSVVDYMFHFKAIIMQKRAEYFAAKEKYNVVG